MFNIEGFQV